MKRKLLSGIIVLAILLSTVVLPVSAASLVDGNLVSNGDFESGNTTGWTVATDATAIVGADYAYNSNYGVLVTPSTGSDASEPSLAYNFPVEANKKYFMSAMIRPTVAWKMMIPVASGCGLPTVSTPLLTTKKVDWFKIVNTIAPTQSGIATFYIQRYWKATETNNLLPSYYLDDVFIYELKLKESEDLNPDKGVLSVNFPADIGLTADMITLSSGSVTGVSYADGNWNIAYANLAPEAKGTVSFAIPINADDSYNNTPQASNTTIKQSLSFTTGESEFEYLYSYSSEPREDVSYTTTKFNFNGDEVGAIPAGITPAPAGVAVTAAKTEGDNLLKITSKASEPVYAKFSLGAAAYSGITDFKYEYYNPTGAGSNFYLTSGANGGGSYAVSISHSGTSISILNEAKQSITVKSGMSAAVWHTVVAHVNMDKRVVTFTIDGIDVKSNGVMTEFPFRTPSVPSLMGGFFGVGASPNTKNFDVDNFEVSRVYTGQTLVERIFDDDELGSAPAGCSCTNDSATTGTLPTVKAKINDGDSSNGAENGYAIEFTGPTESNKVSRATYNMPAVAEGGRVKFSVDWYSAEGGSAQLYLNNKSKAIISLLIGGDKVQHIINGSIQNAKTGLTPGKWHNVAIYINQLANTYKLEVDNQPVIGEFPLREAGSELSTFYIGLHNNYASGKTLQFDNIKVERVFYTQPSSYQDFEKGIGILTGNGGTASTRKDDGVGENGAEAGGAVQMKISNSAATQLNFSLPEKLGSGIVDVSFDLYKSVGSPRLQFYLTNSAGGYNPLSSFINGTSLGAHYSGTYSNTFTEGKWHNVMFHLNFATKTVKASIDGVAVSYNGTDEWSFRSDSLSDETVCDIAKGFFQVDKSDKTDAVIQIDNFRVVRNVTHDTTVAVSGLPEGMTADDSIGRIYGNPSGISVSKFLAHVSTTPSNCEAYITDRNGMRKSDTDWVEKYDRLVIVLDYAGVIKSYELCPLYAIDFRGIEINGNEYFEASKIIEPGKATVRARIRNFSTEPVNVNIYGAVTGVSLYDIETDFGQEIAAGGYKDYKLELNIPDKTDDLYLKLMVMDDEFAPVTEYEQKLIFTSQEISMPNIFSDNMVLQRGEPVNIYGFAPTGTDIKVNFGEYSAEGVAEGGKFLVQLPAMDATNVGKNLEVVANGEVFKTYKDVVVGEVFYGSGQSNMEQALSWETSGREQIGQISNLRYFAVKHLYSTEERTDGTVSESWNVVNSSNWTSVSSLMHCTVYHLRNLGVLDENIPVGIINCSWGGTGIGMWMSADALESISPTSSYYINYLNSVADSKGIRQTDLYSAMAKSVTPYTVKAAVWYQGENDAGSTNYNEYIDTMVAEMRKDFGKDVPYFSIQLPGFNLESWAMFRLTQWKSHNPENGINVVVTNDTGDASDIHPHDKAIVGERVARQMAKNVYGINVPYQGPVYKSATVSGNAVTVSFDFVNDGIHGGLCSIASDGTSLPNFEVSADGKAWYTATASISGDTVVLSSANVSAPAYVRFGYVAGPVKSLGTNSNGVKLPLAPFSEAIN